MLRVFEVQTEELVLECAMQKIGNRAQSYVLGLPDIQAPMRVSSTNQEPRKGETIRTKFVSPRQCISPSSQATVKFFYSRNKCMGPYFFSSVR